VSVSLTCTTAGGFELVVADNGIGLQNERRSGEGTSVGLEFVRNVVTNMGATIDVQREPGTTFTIRVRLPQ
jgi:two-component sensor histidine kinase